MMRFSRAGFVLVVAVGIEFTSSYALAQAPATPDGRQERGQLRQASPSTSGTSRRAHEAERSNASHPSGSDAPISDTPKPMLALTVWAITLTDATGRADDDSKVKPSEQADNLPPEFHSLNEVRDFIQQLKKAKRVRSSRELRIVTLDGQSAQVQVGTDSPQITSSSISNRGRQNAIMYRPLGTVVDVRPRIDSEKHIQIQLDYSLNDTAKSNDVAILEEPDGKSQFADVILHRQLKTMVRLRDGGAVVAHCDATTGWADKSGDGQTELIIIGGAIAKAD